MISGTDLLPGRVQETLIIQAELCLQDALTHDACLLACLQASHQARENALAKIPIPWAEMQAGIAEEEVPDVSHAVATTLGISLTCAAAALDAVQICLCLPQEYYCQAFTCDLSKHFIPGRSMHICIPVAIEESSRSLRKERSGSASEQFVLWKDIMPIPC